MREAFAKPNEFMPFRAHRGKQLVGLSGQRRILGFSGHAIAVELNALGQFAMAEEYSPNGQASDSEGQRRRLLIPIPLAGSGTKK